MHACIKMYVCMLNTQQKQSVNNDDVAAERIKFKTKNLKAPPYLYNLSSFLAGFLKYKIYCKMIAWNQM